jgi:hypothetical protein
VFLWLLFVFLPACNLPEPGSANSIFQPIKARLFMGTLKSFMGYALQPSDEDSVTVVAQRSRSRARRPSRLKKTTSKLDPMIILEGYPEFNGIIAGDSRCTLAQIRRKLGKPEGGTEKWLVYNKKYGIDFWGPAENSPPYEIRLNRGFKGRLSSGISLQSSMDDVFEEYGMPSKENLVDDLRRKFGDSVLFRAPGERAKISYNKHGLLFWFSGGQISQIVVSKKGATFRTTPQKIAAPAPEPQEIVGNAPRDLKPLEVPPVEDSPRWAPVTNVDKLWSYVKVLWIYWYLTLAVLLICAYFLRRAFRWLYYQWRPLPEGRLILIAAPASEEVENINIWYEARRLKKKKLLLGSSSEADICLPHSSVEAIHARISARRTEGQPVTYIEQLGDRDIFVNNTRKTSATLNAKTEVEIGEYRFLYEKPSEYRQVQVQYKNGDVVEGVPTSWDINSRGFALIPSTAPSWADARFIRFEKLKGVYFVEDWDKDVRKKMLKGERLLRERPVNIRFQDGEASAGYLLGDYKKQSPRFYYFPKDQSGGVVYILVERSSIDSLTRVKDGE